VRNTDFVVDFLNKLLNNIECNDVKLVQVTVPFIPHKVE